ncbi:MAG TPA: hypothetical protein VLF62_02550 [Candidatus Saccharimonadales bacterium]|nr:hypothetical protein [Candidatus Saccharimonadales bacterium]
MSDNDKNVKHNRLMFVIFTGVASLLLILFVLEYSEHHAVPFGRIPFIVISISLAAYYFIRYRRSTHR